MSFWNDPILGIAEWLRELLLGWGASDLLTTVVLKFIGAFVVGMGIMLVFVLLTWVERKGAARFQDRIGPNRVGPFGLIQPIADAIKMLTKEDTRPTGADAVSYVLAPIIAVFSVLMVWAVIPFTEKWIGADLSVGIMYIAAAGSFGIVAVMMAGWSSNNKYSLIGAFRGVAQLISYEVPLFLSLLVPVFLARSMGVNSIVEAQGVVLFNLGDIPFLSFIDIPIRGIYFLAAPLAAVIYFVSSLAEVGRAPFDLLEAESELVAGYHVEYSGIKFGLFQAAEFLHSFTFAALMAILFFGGWLLIAYLSVLAPISDIEVTVTRTMTQQRMIEVFVVIAEYTLLGILAYKKKFGINLRTIGYIFFVGFFVHFSMEFTLFLPGIRQSSLFDIVFNSFFEFNMGAPILYLMLHVLVPHLEKRRTISGSS